MVVDDHEENVAAAIETAKQSVIDAADTSHIFASQFGSSPVESIVHRREDGTLLMKLTLDDGTRHKIVVSFEREEW